MRLLCVNGKDPPWMETKKTSLLRWNWAGNTQGEITNFLCYFGKKHSVPQAAGAAWCWALLLPLTSLRNEPGFKVKIFFFFWPLCRDRRNFSRMRGAELSRGGRQGHQQQQRRGDTGPCPTPANQENPIWLLEEGWARWGEARACSALQPSLSFLPAAPPQLHELWARMSSVHTKFHSTSMLAFTEGKYQYSCASVCSFIL